MRDWLVALRAPGLGHQGLRQALERLGDVHTLVRADSATLERAGIGAEAIEAIRHPDEALLARDQRWLEHEGHHLLTLGDEDYPPLLRRIASPPAALWVAGDPALLWTPQVAIVGSRNPTRGGFDHAGDFSATLGAHGFTITSGLAAGIDITAHRAVLDRGLPTIAVMGTGPDVVYPAAHRDDAARIARQGAVVTEFTPGTTARPSHFPGRNRIIAGLSLGVLVVEAGMKSGSLITARLAAEQGREVFALPGSLHNPMAKGCHRLIKQGARLTEATEDIVEALAPVAAELADALRERLGAPASVPAKADAAAAHDGFDDDPDYARLLEAIGHDPVAIDRVIESSGLRAREVSSMLLMLELRDRVELLPGGRVCLRAPTTP
ncbi:DNA-protecting protein DprA [Marinihelvus fidelis]|uniref:DNA-protecting protein DprA n=1 Tax=Marinihelvus fidelis TaxID=2613842 RepID=A0A5N0T974_9GAMM|nr:DNA-processing protein DprA [Marinihelvus fidelis]KAA9131321.1 DNA-protecting protein DprA [Marinihelvus fidelis]